MYEIWLALNIVWETVLTVWPAVLLGALVWLALMVLALRRRGGDWRGGFKLALGAAVAVGIAGVLWLPGATRSSLGELTYWVDWANLLAIAAGFGAVALAFAWPLAALTRRPRH